MPRKVPNPIDIHVGARVRMRRMLIGLSQEKLGERLGLTFQQIQKYEKGANRIGASRLQQISDILEAPISYFFDGAKEADGLEKGFAEPGAQSYTVDVLSTTEGLALNRAFARIQDPKQRRKIVELVKAMAGEDDSHASTAKAGEPSKPG